MFYEKASTLLSKISLQLVIQKFIRMHMVYIREQNYLDSLILLEPDTMPQNHELLLSKLASL